MQVKVGRREGKGLIEVKGFMKENHHGEGRKGEWRWELHAKEDECG